METSAAAGTPAAMETSAAAGTPAAMETSAAAGTPAAAADAPAADAPAAGAAIAGGPPAASAPVVRTSSELADGLVAVAESFLAGKIAGADDAEVYQVMVHAGTDVLAGPAAPGPGPAVCAGTPPPPDPGVCAGTPPD